MSDLISDTMELPARTPHVCRRSTICLCRLDALEPDEACPIHGVGEDRCDCGRFVKRAQPDQEVSE